MTEDLHTNSNPASPGVTLPDPLIYVHIPKAGGTSVRSLLFSKFGVMHTHVVGGANTVASDRRMVERLSPARLRRIRLLAGHNAYGLAGLFPGRRPGYYGIFRHPVSRIVSLYNYIRRTPAHYQNAELVRNGVTLLDFCTSDFSAEVSDGMLKEVVPALRHEPMERSERQVDASVLDQAVEEITNHWFGFGMLERSDESIEMLAHRLGWPQFHLAKRNVSGEAGRGDLTEDVRQSILERNQLDLALYESLRKRFDAEYASYRAEVIDRPRRKSESSPAAGAIDMIRTRCIYQRSKRRWMP